MKSFSFYKGVGLAAGAIAVAMAAGRTYQTVVSRRDLREYPPPGNMIDAGGHRVHMLTMGNGEGPTVLFEAGMASPLECWTRVQQGTAAFAATIAYDRAGNGRSERGPEPRTAERATAELRHALRESGQSGPYVLVAHSYGGLLVRDFAQRYPDDVAGMVLVDVTHPDELKRSPRQASGVEQVEANLRDSLQQATWGLLRLTATPERTRLEGLPQYEQQTALAISCTPQMWAGALAEFVQWRRGVIDEVRGTKLPHDLPLVVLTAERAIEDDSVHLELQRELSELSQNSEHRVIPGADHFSVLMEEQHAAEIVRAVRDVVEAARTGDLLAHSAEPADFTPKG